jgi:hypothetical protein
MVSTYDSAFVKLPVTTAVKTRPAALTAQAVNQRAQTDVISREAFPDSFRIGDRRSRTMPQVSLDPRSFAK